jgi:lysophospholipase L1-like esterase
MALKGPVLGRVALVLASLCFALAGAEGVYRVRSDASTPGAGDDDWYVRYRRLNETLYRRSADAELIYEPVPSSTLEMEYGTAAFNARGLREDRETSLEPIEGRTRVAILGDSLVWSEFLAVDDSIPRRTEEALGEGFEVLNAGVTGYATSQEARWYEMAIRPLRPRVVVLVWCMNDMLIMSGPFERFATGADRAEKDAQDAFFDREFPVRRETIDDVIARRERESTVRLLARALGVWERWRFADHYVDEYLIVQDDEARRARATESLTRLGAAIRADGAVPVLFVSPVLEEWDRYRWSAIHTFVRDAGESAGFRVHDPLDAWRSAHDAAELRMGSDNLHYGRTGSRIFGETIADAVREAIE